MTKPTRQTEAPIAGQSFNVTNRTARELSSMVGEGELSVDAPYQRGDVWTEDQQIALILSWLRGIPVPAVILNNRMSITWSDANPGYDIAASPCYSAIDGKQRLTAAHAWFSGNLAVPASWFAPEDVETATSTDDGPYVKHTGLSKPCRTHQAFTWLLPMAEATLPTVRAEAEVYLIINGGGTPQAQADMDNATRVARES